jgi:hypothetical protein
VAAECLLRMPPQLHCSLNKSGRSASNSAGGRGWRSQSLVRGLLAARSPLLLRALLDFGGAASQPKQANPPAAMSMLETETVSLTPQEVPAGTAFLPSQRLTTRLQTDAIELRTLSTEDDAPRVQEHEQLLLHDDKDDEDLELAGERELLQGPQMEDDQLPWKALLPLLVLCMAGE